MFSRRRLFYGAFQVKFTQVNRAANGFEETARQAALRKQRT
jgi:hypothetical protein